MRPLEGVLVLEFAQFMAGPSAGLKLADLGARVIKIERPGSGEAGRGIALKNLFLDGSSLVFHTANRNKDSYAANLKDPEDLERVKKLIAQADVMTHNFRPGVMEKIGLDYKTVEAINPKMIYATVTGYGTEGPWAKKPGQDLLVQSMSGFANLSGDKDDDPVPVGAALSDIITGTHLAHGILASLLRREKTNKGALVEVSLLESTLDFQFEVITTYLNDGNQKPVRAKQGNAHAYLGAPYGVYKTKDSYISLAMGSLLTLGEVLKCDALAVYTDSDSWFTDRDEIMDILRSFLIDKTTVEWLAILEPAGIWCSDVYDYKKLLNHEAYKVLQMDQRLQLLSGEEVHTTRCPIRVNDERLFASKPAPRVGQHTEGIIKEFNL
ncbi:Crotonobetainyl-CoA:carnitine CoA-transferase CaiB [Lutibacter agarilyticus]|uniref:Crotonobetainyl-CoA:carnitine CoA-transferase CaiB n=1 Tax=Lutibacter agarilyticus TaxID=1109740 RepID=A0A238VAP6_9FLAO|nr:CoA transferase [Lutibacter agarilyticus]SNR31268.1 Crotonobetainyl-CoA:carnitine CoA-transferase CaiB [Lutibacter agarilyticus]